MGDETGHTEYVWSTEPQPVDDRTPYIGHFAFENMTCEGVEYSAGAFYGLPEAPIAGIVLKNVSFTYAADAQSGFPDMKEKNQKECKQGLYFQFVESVKLENVSIVGCEGKAITKIGVEKFTQK
jgi:polygalacturonase